MGARASVELGIPNERGVDIAMTLQSCNAALGRLLQQFTIEINAGTMFDVNQTSSLAPHPGRTLSEYLISARDQYLLVPVEGGSERETVKSTKTAACGALD